MPAITVDEKFKQSLGDIKEEVLVYDAEGRALGSFRPYDDAEARLVEEVMKRVDWEEIRRRKELNRPGRTTAEVFERLDRLEDSSCE
jgi:hypothetical protein